jgi:hypothetical protein
MLCLRADVVQRYSDRVISTLCDSNTLLVLF